MTAVLFVAVSAAVSADDAGFVATQLGILGPTQLRVDLVIVGDGYIEEDFRPGGAWEIDTRRLVKNFFEKIPFKETRHLFNVHLVEAVSKDRGADDRPTEDTKDTVFNCSYGVDGVARLLCHQNEEAVEAAARAAPAADILVMLVNDSRDGGSGGELGGLPTPTCSNAPDAFLIAIHELGHSFANLADEYVDPSVESNYPLPESGDLPEPNVTLAQFVDFSSKKTILETLKWGHFLEEPAAARKYGQGYFEGGFYRATGVFRPARSCVMSDVTGSGQFCFVCLYEMRAAIGRTSIRNLQGGISGAPLGRIAPALRRLHYEYTLGAFGNVLKALEKVLDNGDPPNDVRDDAQRLADSIASAFETNEKRIEDLRASGEWIALSELLGAMKISFKGTRWEMAVKDLTQTIEKSSEFKSGLRVALEFEKLRADLCVSPSTRQNRPLLVRRLEGFVEKYPGTPSAQEATKYLDALRARTP